MNNKLWFALCDGTRYEIYAVGRTKLEATHLLWCRVRQYLKDSEADMGEIKTTDKGLTDWFGYRAFEIEAGDAGFVNG